MSNRHRHTGFSLTEILIAVGILSVGMVFIAGVFPAGLYYATVATERTIAAVVADEAFAKIRIYANNPGNLIDLSRLSRIELRPNENVNYTFSDILPAMDDPNEFLYPSTMVSQQDPCRQYCWSALFRRVAPPPNRLVQVTVFISRKVSPNLEYYCADTGGSGDIDWVTPEVNNWPTPVKVAVLAVSGRANELEIDDETHEKMLINDGYTIVDDVNGMIYRVLERYRDDPATAQEEDAIILLDRNWQGTPANVWVVPPPAIGNPPVIQGRYPCIAVYQKIIRF